MCHAQMAAERDVTGTGTTNEDENECRGDAAESLAISTVFKDRSQHPTNFEVKRRKISSGEMNRYRTRFDLLSYFFFWEKLSKCYVQTF